MREEKLITDLVIFQHMQSVTIFALMAFLEAFWSSFLWYPISDEEEVDKKVDQDDLPYRSHFTSV